MTIAKRGTLSRQIDAESILATIREPMLVLDAELHVVFANHSFYSSFHVDKKETEDQRIYDLGNGQWDIPALKQLLEDLLPKNTEFNNFEVEQVFPAIGQRTMLLNARRIYKEHEKTQLILLAIEDITGRKQAEKSLRRASIEWSQCFDALAAHICILDMSGKIIRANKSMRNRFEPEHGKLEGLDYRLIYCGTASPDPQPPCAAVLTGGVASVDVETTLPTMDGYYQVSCSACLDENGVQWGSISVVSDISERKRIQKSLIHSQRYMRQIIETARDAFVSMDEAGNIIDWNPQAEALFGWSKKEVLGKSVGDSIVPLPSRKNHKRGLKHYLASGESSILNRLVETTAQHHDGHTFPVELSIVPLQTRDNNIFNAFVRDISERHKSQQQLKSSLVGTIVAVSRAIGARDPYTEGHQQRVAQLARCIAQEMGLDNTRIDGLRMGATIHDIGKIYLPAEILSKPSKLSETEFELIKSHCQVGYDILKDIEFPWPIADIAHQHHERLDGTGYPQGLKGDEICMEARIVAVADVVEAISSHRPYRAALGMDVALQEIEKHRGEWYEPAAVDACLNLCREKDFNFDINGPKAL